MTTLTRADWEQRARDLKIEGRAYINGEYTAAVSSETFECISPVDGRVLATIASCDAADAQRAVENARSVDQACSSSGPTTRCHGRSARPQASPVAACARPPAPSAH